MAEKRKKWDFIIQAAAQTDKYKLIEIGQMNGFMGLYKLGLEHMYDYLMNYNEVRKHGKWELLDECSNAGMYCSVCGRRVYKTDYANQKLKSKYCPNCGAKMDLDGE